MEGSFVPKSDAEATTARYADMLAALGAEPRLRIVRVLLAAHPEGLVVGEIGSELGIPPSTLSHHLEKLKNEGLVAVRRESTFLRYTADTATFRNRLASCSPSATPAAGDQTRSRYLRPRMKGAM
jgi:DNA-binding transcriptional ArsR family regulator